MEKEEILKQIEQAAKYTPGPWKVDNIVLAKTGSYAACELDISQHEDADISPRHGVPVNNIATVWCHSQIPTKEEQATAALIASAPIKYRNSESMENQ